MNSLNISSLDILQVLRKVSSKAAQTQHEKAKPKETRDGAHYHISANKSQPNLKNLEILVKLRRYFLSTDLEKYISFTEIFNTD